MRCPFYSNVNGCCSIALARFVSIWVFILSMDVRFVSVRVCVFVCLFGIFSKENVRISYNIVECDISLNSDGIAKAPV